MLNGHDGVRLDLAVGFVGPLLSGFASIWYIATANALVQMRAELTYGARVMGVWVMALPGTTPVTSLLAAALASAAGIGFACLTAGLVVLAVALSGRRVGAVADFWPGALASGPLAHVPLEYSIVSLTCAVTSRFDAVMVGLPGAAQDRLRDSSPAT